MTGSSQPPWIARLPFFYGWVIIGIAFVTMAISVTARTVFSLLLPPILDEFKWDRGMAAGAFSFGFIVFAVLSPLVGIVMDRRGPRFVIEAGVVLLVAGLLLSVLIATPWQLYLTLGVLVGAGANCMSYSAQSQYLPNWFVRRRGLALSIAFSGVGAGAILLLPWLQTVIERDGWRSACWTLGILAAVILVPVNLIVWKRPQDLGLLPDGDSNGPAKAGEPPRRTTTIVDAAWVGTTWTLRRAACTARFWWIAFGYFCALFVWYAVQVHQTKYLVEVGFSAYEAAWALGLVSVVAIPGQIALGALSDRIGREWVWIVSCAGFAICYAALIGLEHHPSRLLMYTMVVSQGLIGYGMVTVMGPIVAEIFEGPHFGSIFGTITVAMIAGGAVGPWVTGVVHDKTGSYRIAFAIAIACCLASAVTVWLAAPRKVRLVPGRAR
jgi:MFS family permease